MTRKRRILSSVLLALVLILGILYLVWGDLVIHRIGTVRPGVLYRSAQLSESKLGDIVDAYDIRTIVNLRKHDLQADRRMEETRGVRVVWLPSDQVPAEENIQAFLKLMDDPGSLPVLIHCEHGVGRTGVLAGVYRLEYERASIEEVLEEARFFAFGGSYWEGQDKTEFLKHYVPRWTRSAD